MKSPDFKKGSHVHMTLLDFLLISLKCNPVIKQKNHTFQVHAFPTPQLSQAATGERKDTWT